MNWSGLELIFRLLCSFILAFFLFSSYASCGSTYALSSFMLFHSYASVTLQDLVTVEPPHPVMVLWRGPRNLVIAPVGGRWHGSTTYRVTVAPTGDNFIPILFFLEIEFRNGSFVGACRSAPPTVDILSDWGKFETRFSSDLCLTSLLIGS